MICHSTLDGLCNMQWPLHGVYVHAHQLSSSMGFVAVYLHCLSAVWLGMQIPTGHRLMC